ncbi:hypothetical protein L1049_006783 [Liquidambar formosana]|uniref:SBP-type domain-containing protein n=1 Tax=Liquidambar formosana TaxID=63359 RepID=A0AAP0RGE6_LIQFO
MGYNLKKSSWDLTELEKEGTPNTATIVSSGRQKTEGDCLADLKLGRFGDSVDRSKDPRLFVMESSSSSGSSKRARVPGSGTQVVSCLVDGCTSDLSKCRDYHRRHKVCELHSKTPKVTIGGQEQRFCQQCSRFHSLVEFDEGKRSCRKRLDGHNRRRRKPQPDSLSLNSGRFLSTHQGARFFPFSGPQIFPTSSMVTSAWDVSVKAESDAMLYNSHSQFNFIDRKNSFPISFSHSYKGGKQFPFLQGTDSTLPGASSSVCQQLLDPNSTSKNHGRSHKMFSDRAANQVINSDRALSLLSSPPTETREIGLSHMVQPDPVAPAQPSLIPNLHYNSLGMEVEPVDSVLVADGSSSSNANLHCQGMFQMGPDGSSASGTHQTISFAWE